MTTRLVNFTNLPIKVRNDYGKIKLFDVTPFTPVYRIEPFMIRRAVPYIDSFRADAVKKIEIINLPVYDPLVAYITSIEMMVIACNMGRFDFFAPDYKNHPLRDEVTGEVIGITRFITLAEPGIDGFMNPPFLNAGYPPPQGPYSYPDIVADVPSVSDSTAISISQSVSLSTSLSGSLSTSTSLSTSISTSNSISTSLSTSISTSISEATPATPSAPSV